MSNDTICVICQENTQTHTNPFLSPCNCKGSVASIHRDCLETWISHSNQTNCSVCRAKYQVRYVEETVGISEFKILMKTTMYFVAGMTILTSLFYLCYWSTYQFESTKFVDRLSQTLLTTYVHAGIHVWYLFLSLVTLIFAFTLIISIVTIFTGDSSSGPSIDSYDINNFFRLAESTTGTYPIQKAVMMSWKIHFASIFMTGLVVFATYALVKVLNPPITKRRIKI